MLHQYYYEGLPCKTELVVYYVVKVIGNHILLRVDYFID
jgi:hypothetical protein